MSESEPRVWTCKHCARVMGFIVRGSDRRTRLHVLKATCNEINAKAMAEVKPLVVLDAGTVTCGWCGAERTWSMSEATMDDLLARRKTRTFGLEA